MAQGFAVAVRLVDLATGPLATINRSIVKLEKSAKQVARQGGLFEARDALRKIKDEAESVGEGLAKVFSPLQGLMGAGSIGGLALLAERFARVGSEINRTSATLGLNTTDLQKWRGAADLAGVGAEAMTTSIAGAAHGIYLMRNGLDPDMFRVVQRWGLDANKGATDAEKAANLILQVADKIRTDPSLRNNAQAQRTLLGQLGIDERMLWLMQQGKEKIQEFAEASKRHSYLTQEQIDRAQELQFAYNGLTQSVGGFTNAVAAEMSKWMTPMLRHWSEWIDKLKETPSAMKAVEYGAEGLAIVFGGTMVAGIVKLIAKLNAFWALPAIRFLLSPAGAGLGAILGLTSHGYEGFIPGRLPRHGSEESFRQHAVPNPQPDWIQRQFNRAWDALGLPHHQRGITAEERGRIGEATSAYERLGWTHPQAVGIAANQFKESRLQNVPGDSGLAQGFGQWHPDRQADFRGLFGHDIAQATPDEQYRFTDWELRHTEALAGKLLGAATTGAQSAGVLSKFYERPRNRESEALERAALGKEIEGWGQPAAVAGNRRGLWDRMAGWTVHSAKAAAPILPRQPERPAWQPGIGALPKVPDLMLPDVNVTAPSMLRMPAVGEPASPPGVSGAEPSAGAPIPPALLGPRMPTAAEPAAGGSSGPQGSLNLDSSHKVEVHFVNAPLGMRSGLTKSEGPAEVSVRTHYSMDNLS